MRRVGRLAASILGGSLWRVVYRNDSFKYKFDVEAVVEKVPMLLKSPSSSWVPRIYLHTIFEVCKTN
eukprot:scaffold4652_cov54-Attheya_sp.AAC.4